MSGNSCKINQMGLSTTKRERTAKINLRKYFYKLDKNVTYKMNKSTLVISIAEKTLTQPVPTSAFWGLQGQSQLELAPLQEAARFAAALLRFLFWCSIRSLQCSKEHSPLSSKTR